ncbi:MAG: hypothetical protein AAFU64_01805, partial [Bacteroidota bacterium]
MVSINKSTTHLLAPVSGKGLRVKAKGGFGKSKISIGASPGALAAIRGRAIGLAGLPRALASSDNASIPKL